MHVHFAPRMAVGGAQRSSNLTISSLSGTATGRFLLWLHSRIIHYFLCGAMGLLTMTISMMALYSIVRGNARLWKERKYRGL